MDTLQTAEPFASFLIDTAAKGSVILLLALVVTFVLRRSSAAMRHRMWTLTMLSLILLPLASLILPAWSVAILPASTQVESTTGVAIHEKPDTSLPALSLINEAPVESVQARSVASWDPAVPIVPQPDDARQPRFAPTVAMADSMSDADSEKQRTAPASEISKEPSWAFSMIALIWSLGVTVFTAGMASSLRQAGLLRRQSELSTDPAWRQLLAELSLRFQLRRPVELREHREAIVPLTWGLFWPVVLLPRKSREWAQPMKRSVLLHELAHVRRADVACQLLGRIACTLFWFHPLAWYVLRQLRQEGEQACDDAVIRSGEKSSDYAEQLLQVAHLCCVRRGLSMGVAMAEGNSLEVRVRSLFDKTRSHDPVRNTASLALTFVCATVLVGVSVIRPVASSADEAEFSAALTHEFSASDAAAQQQPLELDSPPELPTGAPPTGPATENPTPSEPKPASPPEPSLDEQAAKVPLKDVIWWEKVEGLQAGFLLDSPGIPNQRIPHHSVAKYRILVRNTTDKDIKFVARLLSHDGADAPFLIPSDDITESLAAPKLPEKFRTEGVPRQFKRHDPAYIVTLAPGEAVFVPGQSGLDELSLYVGDAEERKHPTAAKIRPGLNWIVQPLQLQRVPTAGFPNGASLMGRYKITRVDSDGVARQESASRMVAVPGGKTLHPRIQLDVGTLTAAAVRNSKDAVWGKVDKGLQCGIRMINPKQAYVVGDTLEAEFLWRNTSDATIFTPLPRQFDLYPIVTNAEGQELSVDFGARMLLLAISLPFEAGQVRSLGVSKITLVDKGTPSPRSNLEPAHLIVEPGVYKLSGSGGVSAPEGGRPRSGAISFVVIGHEVVGREPAPNLDRKQKQKVAKARIEELGGEVRPYDETTVAVTLWKTKATDKDLELIKCFDLVALGLTGTRVTDAGLVHIKDMKRLGDLELTDTKVTDAGLAHLTKLGHLGILSLYGTKVTDLGLQHLKPLKSLYLLGLSHTAVTDKGLVHLSELPSLETLILDHLKITDRGMVHLQNLKTLKDIRLGGTEITDKGLEHLQKMPLLRTVELSQTRITGSGLRHLPASTQTLWLPLTQVDDDGLKHIAHLTKLETLVLNNSKITDEGLKLLERHSSLHDLQIGQTKVTDAGVARLEAALPNCKVSR